jgi:hypothetical protein
MKTTLTIVALFLTLCLTACRTAGVGGFLVEPVGDCRPAATAPASLTRDDLTAIIAACRPVPAPVAPAAPRKYTRTVGVDGGRTEFTDADGTKHVLVDGWRETLEVVLPEGVDFAEVRDEKLPVPSVDPMEVRNLRREVERMKAAAEAAQQAPAAPAQPVQYLQPRAPRGMEYRDGMYVPSHR